VAIKMETLFQAAVEFEGTPHFKLSFAPGAAERMQVRIWRSFP